MKGPSTLRWVALGLGDKMAGANMFLVYAASSGTNVTASPRSAPGHVPPTLTPESQIFLFSGSGIQNGVITANIRCDTCLDGQRNLWGEDLASSRWIWAYKIGPPMNSDDISADIDFHDDFGSVLIDLTSTSANIGDKEPFLDPIWNAVRPLDDADNPKAARSATTAIVHGCLMGLTFVVLMPIFALLVPISAFIPISVVKVHAPLQMFALFTAIAGLGLGIKLWIHSENIPAAHPIIGIVAVACLCIFQPIFGWLQHLHFERTGARGLYAFLHRWLGRGIIIVGIINCGLGLLWAYHPQALLRVGKVVYSILATTVVLGYVAVHFGIFFYGRRQPGIRLNTRDMITSSDNLIPRVEQQHNQESATAKFTA
ncbi:hypothetical protein LOZ55_003692 [Ophidiomyces ophidiicola]|nr:hypothetical protein LOZ55_003692 [Ophidiomyces ophidiicola]KAI2087551.1 hypothetical protein LOZ36_002689 [Ophidiomyces ophidiicola]